MGVEEVWQRTRCQDGSLRSGTAVAELTSLVSDDSLPTGTRLIVRRKPLHPGVKRSLFPNPGYRYWGFTTDANGDPVDLDVTMRAHAHVKAHIQRLKDSGLCRFPFSKFTANEAWMAAVMLAADLVAWLQLLCLEGTSSVAHRKALRSGLFHIPGRLVRSGRLSIMRIIEGRPTTDVLTNAYKQLALITWRDDDLLAAPDLQGATSSHVRNASRSHGMTAKVGNHLFESRQTRPAGPGH